MNRNRFAQLACILFAAMALSACNKPSDTPTTTGTTPMAPMAPASIASR